MVQGSVLPSLDWTSSVAIHRDSEDDRFREDTVGECSEQAY